jgi:hypothetical protein
VSRALAVAAVAVALAACPKKGPDQPATPEVTCDNVGAAYAADLTATADQAVDPNAQALDRAMIAAVVESCTADAWTPAARACVADARSQAGDKCRGELTEAQLLALTDRMDSAAAKVSPASCAELSPLISHSFDDDVAGTPPDQQGALRTRIDDFAAAIGTQCEGGWSIEARTCVRDSIRDGQDAGRCARWLDDSQRAAYIGAVEAAFGPPPAPPPAP